MCASTSSFSEYWSRMVTWTQEFGANLGSTVRPSSKKGKEKRDNEIRQDRHGDKKNGNRRQNGLGELLKLNSGPVGHIQPVGHWCESLAKDIQCAAFPPPSQCRHGLLRQHEGSRATVLKTTMNMLRYSKLMENVLFTKNLINFLN